MHAAFIPKIPAESDARLEHAPLRSWPHLSSVDAPPPAGPIQLDGGRASTLVIEDDHSVARFFHRALQSAGFDVTVALSGTDGVMAARQRRFAAILLDMRLPDLDGMDVLRTLAAECRDVRVVVISGYLTVRSTVEAIRLGATEVLEKPVSEETLLAAVAAAAAVTPEPSLERMAIPAPAPHAADGHSVADRWASDLMRGCLSPRDAKTLGIWAKSAGTSSRMLCERCGMLEIKPHDARDLMRALFAMLRGGQEGCAPHVLLDIADGRTLQTFRGKAGPDFVASRDLAAINRFLDSQRFVDPRNYGITVLRSQLARLLSSDAC